MKISTRVIHEIEVSSDELLHDSELIYEVVQYAKTISRPIDGIEVTWGDDNRSCRVHIICGQQPFTLFTYSNSTTGNIVV